MSLRNDSKSGTKEHLKIASKKSAAAPCLQSLKELRGVASEIDKTWICQLLHGYSLDL